MSCTRAALTLVALVALSAAAATAAGPSAPHPGHRGVAARGGGGDAMRPEREDTKDAVDLGGPVRIPDGFILGAGSSSYQIEGAWNVSGKGPSTADYAYGSETGGGGAVACDSYHHYTEDVAMLKLMGATHYRFSIAWARLLPTGEGDNVNPDGVRYYNALLDELVANGIQPLVTLWHVDIPLALEEAFGGWQDPRIVDYFEAYAVTAFKHFGDRVRLWTTMNEPHMFCVYGAGHGRMGATRVDQGRSEYRCAHHVLLAHARAYRTYKRDFASRQGGKLGISLDSYYTRPCTNSFDDVLAAERHQHFELGWFLEPILGVGDYPALMRKRVTAGRLPTFTPEQKAELKGSLDFIGLNSYYGWTACDGVPANAGNPSYERDQAVNITEVENMNMPPSAFTWSPWSIRSSLLWMRDRYDPTGSIPFIITENGYGTDGKEGLQDDKRIAYLSAWMRKMFTAIQKDSINVIGYFVWSLLDDFEWGVGYGTKLGIVHVDFNSPNRTRTPKKSLYFLKEVIAKRTVHVIDVPSSASRPPPGVFSLISMLLLPLFLYK